MSAEKDPTGKTIGQPGCKVDAGKAPVLQGFLHYFPRAVLAVAEISAFGVQKGYAWNSWETVENGINRYGDAEVRHLVKEAIEGPLDSQSQKLHAAHEAWNAMARLELICREEEKALVEVPATMLDRRVGLKDRRVGHEDATCPICKGLRGALRKSFVLDRRKS